MTDNRDNEVPREPHENQWPLNPEFNQGQAPVAPTAAQNNFETHVPPTGEPQRPMGYNTPYTPPVGAVQHPKKQSKVLPLVVGFSLVSALLGGSIGGIIGSSSSQEANRGSAYSASETKDIVNTVKESTTSNLSEVINEKLPSIVTISVISGETGGTGSGVVLNDEGYIVTNAHVATLEGQTANGDINVQTSTGDTYKAEFVGYDSTSDLAVLKIDPEAKGISPISFASSESLEVGTETIAVGSPLGLSGTVTTGIISALNRPISVTSSEVNENSSPSNNGRGQGQGRGQSQNQEQASVALSAIQTDAAINSGNSGGALLDANGNLIGINVAIASTGETAGSIGVGFAIPSDYVKRVIAEIVANGEATHGYLGAGVVDYNDSNATFTSGAQIESVEPGSAADESGLRKGDVVTKLNGNNIESAIQLTAVVKQLAPGSSVEIAYERGSEEKNITVKLGDINAN
jgi:putative serine protease PepD